MSKFAQKALPIEQPRECLCLKLCVLESIVLFCPCRKADMLQNAVEVQRGVIVCARYLLPCPHELGVRERMEVNGTVRQRPVDMIAMRRLLQKRAVKGGILAGQNPSINEQSKEGFCPASVHSLQVLSHSKNARTSSLSVTFPLPLFRGGECLPAEASAEAGEGVSWLTVACWSLEIGAWSFEKISASVKPEISSASFSTCAPSNARHSI